MAIITCVTTLQESLDHTVNYVWHILKREFPPNVCPFQSVLRSIRRRRPHRIVESSAAQQAPRGRGEAGITDDNRHSVPAGVNGRGCAASLRGPVAAARYATTLNCIEQLRLLKHTSLNSRGAILARSRGITGGSLPDVMPQHASRSAAIIEMLSIAESNNRPMCRPRADDCLCPGEASTDSIRNANSPQRSS
jgi:hypothetical protein